MQTQPVHSLAGHQAAVKALAWCPFQSNLLATGGGTADRTIRFWNTCTGAQLNSIDTGSQVCLAPLILLSCTLQPTACSCSKQSKTVRVGGHT